MKQHKFRLRCILQTEAKRHPRRCLRCLLPDSSAESQLVSLRLV